MTGDIDLDLKARQILVLSEGFLDAFVLLFFESARPEDKRSQEWMQRQDRKIDGGFRAFSDFVKNRKGEYVIGDGSVYTIADIAIVCAVNQVDFGGLRPNWKEHYPELAEWYDKMNEREHFASTRPVM